MKRLRGLSSASLSLGRAMSVKPDGVTAMPASILQLSWRTFHSLLNVRERPRWMLFSRLMQFCAKSLNRAVTASTTSSAVRPVGDSGAPFGAFSTRILQRLMLLPAGRPPFMRLGRSSTRSGVM